MLFRKIIIPIKAREKLKIVLDRDEFLCGRPVEWYRYREIAKGGYASRLITVSRKTRSQHEKPVPTDYLIQFFNALQR